MATSDELWRAAQVITDGDRRDYAHALHTDVPWPRPFDTWFGGDYPVARGQGASQGWQCPGCGRCYSPAVYQCGACVPQATSSTGANEPTEVITNCPPSADGSMCSCETPDDAPMVMHSEMAVCNKGRYHKPPCTFGDGV